MSDLDKLHTIITNTAQAALLKTLDERQLNISVILVGNINNSTGIAIGHGASASVVGPTLPVLPDTKIPLAARIPGRLVLIYAEDITTPSAPALLLERRLALRGLHVGLGLISGQLLDADLNAELSNADAIVVIIGGSSTNGHIVNHTLVPALRKLRRIPNPPSIHLVLDQVPEDALYFRSAELTNQALPIHAPQAQSVLDQLASIITLNVLPPLLTAKQVSIGLIAHPKALSVTGNDILINMLPWYANGDPDPETWQTWLLPALVDVKGACVAAKVRDVTVLGMARLSAGLAFGYVFRESAHIFLRAEQRVYGPNGEAVELLSVGDLADPSIPLAENVVRQEPIELNANAPDVTIELSTARNNQDIQNDVDRWVAANPQQVRERIRLRITAETLNRAQIAAVTRELARRILAVGRRPNPPQTIHLFTAMPQSVAFLLGWRLNTAAPIQCYELEISPVRQYRQSVLLV
ncbi:MAG: SAVED domain-containing protein [Roseiflexaceae bacterium]|nr:SAVED domain-containing protein [Roseiflexaceae bacterium]